jgi:hypothetical protein
LKELLDDVYLKVALGEQPFETSILLLEFTDAGRFIDVHAAEVTAPVVEDVLGYVVLTTDLGDGLVALLGLLQNGDDLLVDELALLHTSILPFGSILTSQLVQFLRDRSVPHVKR